MKMIEMFEFFFVMRVYAKTMNDKTHYCVSKSFVIYF